MVHQADQVSSISEFISHLAHLRLKTDPRCIVSMRGSLIVDRQDRPVMAGALKLGLRQCYLSEAF